MACSDCGMAVRSPRAARCGICARRANGLGTRRPPTPEQHAAYAAALERLRDVDAAALIRGVADGLGEER